MSVLPDAPLIVTLLLDEATQHRFNALRQAHFPAARNYLQAHVTLFHHLPGSGYAAVAAELRNLAATTAPLPVQVTGLRFLGQGVAYSLENAALQQLHRHLQTTWANWLTPQDRQPLRPHVTVQNKVLPAVARELHAQLALTFQPGLATGVGLGLWAYRGGPWEALDQFAFAGK
ncbi:2'-5' RNA ligase family protein [Hymenobacter rubripertinctus]|uniref:2'-5' RNA ligase family protein n=1 Tax=Hymenobacter rubripertinctus TaxID=2029981 RepID=A0A418QVT5_9BACT|nr:2'-5' RNA ligase family protein [Hymenobacter rubripertinctus]RIY09307.1 2'-5' RNA ligase family protein [Hymenobacter rubripertinctus]